MVPNRLQAINETTLNKLSNAYMDHPAFKSKNHVYITLKYFPKFSRFLKLTALACSLALDDSLVPDRQQAII